MPWLNCERSPVTRATNNTVLGVASLSTTIPIVGGVLLVLFVLMKPEATAGFAFHQRLAFWTAHIGFGLAGLLLASRLLRPHWMLALPVWVAVLLTGIAGAAVLAPVYLFLEVFIPAQLVAEPDDWLDRFAMAGPLQAMLAEFIEVTPVFLAAWFAVNLPLILGRSELDDSRPFGPSDPEGEPLRRRTLEPPEDATESSPSLFERVPRALGRDVVLISSDMHYLHVYTTLGKCMVLGTLRDAAQELAEAGMLVHRSHWVAHAHVQKLARRGSGWSCRLTNGMSVPVSRRNRNKATEWYGRTGNVISLTASQRKSGPPQS
jgi:hypothetical protein